MKTATLHSSKLKLIHPAFEPYHCEQCESCHHEAQQQHKGANSDGPFPYLAPASIHVACKEALDGGWVAAVAREAVDRGGKVDQCEGDGDSSTESVKRHE